MLKSADKKESEKLLNKYETNKNTFTPREQLKDSEQLLNLRYHINNTNSKIFDSFNRSDEDEQTIIQINNNHKSNCQNELDNSKPIENRSIKTDDDQNYYGV